MRSPRLSRSAFASADAPGCPSPLPPRCSSCSSRLLVSADARKDAPSSPTPLSCSSSARSVWQSRSASPSACAPCAPIPLSAARTTARWHSARADWRRRLLPSRCTAFAAMAATVPERSAVTSASERAVMALASRVAPASPSPLPDTSSSVSAAHSGSTCSSGCSSSPKPLRARSRCANAPEAQPSAASAWTVCEASAAPPSALCDSPSCRSFGKCCCSTSSSAGTCRSSFGRITPVLGPPSSRWVSAAPRSGQRSTCRANAVEKPAPSPHAPRSTLATVFDSRSDSTCCAPSSPSEPLPCRLSSTGVVR
mmetsp:Transcript_3547/g.9152  ORF Transcript_3547/g.9152 Transcript_3547/m.9152 type:complete len:310 (-) Transcript_3547:254-1183(-)